MNTTHTPGDWFWSEDGKSLQTGEPCNRTNIVSVRTDARDGVPHLSVSAADRRLIAAAPDLLEALRRFMPWVLSVSYMKPALNPAQEERLTADINLARAAIAKATAAPPLVASPTVTLPPPEAP